MTIRSRIILALSVLALVVFFGSAGFHYIENWSWFEGLYMTIITMTPLGYGEVKPLSHAGKVFNTFLILASVLAGGFTIATFTQILLEFEFAEFFGRRRMERELAKLTDHYIICGAGRVGRTVARELRAQGQRCVILEVDSARAGWAVEEKIPVIIGTGANEHTLTQAHIEQARGFVAGVSTDADNLYIVLTARGMRADLKIIARASEEEAISKLLRAGATQVISPYHFVGHRIAHLFLRPNVLDFIDTAFGSARLDVEIEEVPVSENSSVVGKTLGDSLIRRQEGVVILALKRSDGVMAFNPPPDAVIRAGDCLIAIGESDKLKNLENLAKR